MSVPFVGALIGVVVLVALYRWPRVNLAVYYFTVRPAFVWFGMLAPLVLVGVLALRPRWFLCGCAIWMVAFVATEEVAPCLKLFPGRARAAFSSARMGFMSYMDSGGPKAEVLSVPLRVISWNVLEGRKGARGAVEQLAALDPDIVLMQEFGPGRQERMVDAIAASTHFKGYHVHGDRTAILSRFPVTRLQNGPLPGGRGSVWRVEIASGVSLICASVHLSPPELKTQLVRGWSRQGVRDAIALKRRELAQLRGALDLYRLQGPIILAGDFNVPPRYADLRGAVAGLKDCFRANGYGWGKTAPARLPAVRADMIFVPPEARVHYAAAIPTPYSDHYMSLAEVAVPAHYRTRLTGDLRSAAQQNSEEHA